jgi:SAM-dependent methyltransferase
MENLMTQTGTYNEYKAIAELYDYVVGFFVEAAKESGGPVLEVGCGTGRVLIPTAQAGIEITGLDLSTDMLEICREHLKAEPEEVQSKVRLVEADMRQFELAQKFQLVTLPFRPFQHLTTVAEQLACLGCIHAALAEDGKLILDIFNPALEGLTRTNFGEELSEEPEFSMPDGRKVIRRHAVTSRDVAKQINYVELIYYITHPDGRKERLVQAFPMRYLFRFEAEHLLARAGFDVEQLYADYDKKPFGAKYPGELIFVARKAKG